MAAEMPVALVTGCSTGVGLHTAVRLARAGHRVVATMRDTARQEGLLAEANSAGVSLEVRKLDVADHAAINASVASIIDDHGRIDVLVNNAGAGLVGSIEQTSDADLRRIMEVNFFGVWNTTKAVIPHMRTAGSGRVISVTSVGGMVGQPFNDAYCASKFAVEGFMESFAPVALAMGIKLSVVAPGPINTAFVANVESTSVQSLAAMTPPYDRMVEKYKALAGQSFSMAGQTPDEVAEIVVTLACAEKPDFRVVTSPLVTAAVAMKANDESGSAVVESFTKLLGL
jgi:NAD(P)-dependent dehydrogenase (short-subunit alcohol dehydrogenase family)